jgi:hypothetical protein
MAVRRSGLLTDKPLSHYNYNLVGGFTFDLYFLLCKFDIAQIGAGDKIHCGEGVF